MFDLPSDEDKDWTTETYTYDKSGLTVSTLTRQSGMGISRSTWPGAHIMGQYLEANFQSFGFVDSVDALELGSGTGLGGIHASKYLATLNLKTSMTMTYICEKALKNI